MSPVWRRTAAPWSLAPVDMTPAQPGVGRVRVRVEAAAIDPWEATPVGRGPGVAAVGLVTGVGPATDEWLGLRVLVPTCAPCGECERCRRGGAVLCAAATRLGSSGPGALATTVTAMARWLVRLEGPLALPGPAAAALGGEIAMAYALYARAGVGPRDPAIVLGSGPRARLVAELLHTKGLTPVVATHDAAVIAALGDRAQITAQHTAAIEDALAPHGVRPRKVVVTDGALLDTALRIAGPRATVVVAADVMPALSPLTPLELALCQEAVVVGVAGCHPDLVPELVALAVRGDLALDAMTDVVAVAALGERLAERDRTRPATTLVATL